MRLNSWLNKDRKVMWKYKKIVFHCGLHKTGTSYLQSVLRRNRGTLSELKVDFPEYKNTDSSGIHDGNHSFVATQYNPSITLKDFLTQRLEFSPEADVLIISAEELSSGAVLANWIDKLPDLIGEADVQFVYYIRRFDHLIESVYAESVKRSLVGGIENAAYQLSFSKTIGPIVEAFGKSKVSVRPYNKNLWDNGSLGQDFFTTIGLPEVWGKLETDEITSKNVSFERAQTFILSRLKTLEAKKSMIRYFVENPPNFTNDKSKYFMSPDARMKLNRNHCIEQRGFFEDIGFGDIKEKLDLFSFPDADRWTEFDPNTEEFRDYTFRYIEAKSDGFF